MIRILLVGYCYSISSDRRLCQEVEMNLACRWFCRLGLEGAVPDHSTFSVNQHERFRDSDILRSVFESVVQKCMGFGLVGGEGSAVNASVIDADASRFARIGGADIDWTINSRSNARSGNIYKLVMANFLGKSPRPSRPPTPPHVVLWTRIWRGVRPAVRRPMC